LGLETTRGRCPQTVRRAAPCLFGLYGLVALWYDHLAAGGAAEGAVQWAGKQTTTFSDAISAVRRWLWQHWVFANADPEGGASWQAGLPEGRRLHAGCESSLKAHGSHG
jgi:hypothetical protein